jgi:HPr kinase/phosphorylase
LEVRGLGIVQVACTEEVRLALAVELAAAMPRLPAPARDPRFGVPLIRLDPAAASAAARVALALDCALGRVRQIAGAFAA